MCTQPMHTEISGGGWAGGTVPAHASAMHAGAAVTDVVAIPISLEEPAPQKQPYSQPQMATIQVVVPNGAAPGSTMNVALADGRVVSELIMDMLQRRGEKKNVPL